MPRWKSSGPAYTWKTESWLDGNLNEGRLDGNLVLKGYGDPKFNLESLLLFVRDLRNRGLREINGDLVLDRSFFSVEAHDPGQFDNEPTRPYNVGPDALLINFKSFRLQFVPDDENRSVLVYSEPLLPQVNVVNNLHLAPGFCDVWPEKPAVAGNNLTFFGVFPSSCGEKSRYFSLLSPNDYVATLFRQFWQQAGGTWTGKVREAQLPPDAKLFSSLGITPAFRTDPRRQQIQHQRDGAPDLPDAGHARYRPARNAGEIRPGACVTGWRAGK